MLRKKNICIAILLISNSCTLYLLYTTHQETLSYEKNRIYNSLKDQYEDEAAMQEALKEHIVSEYKDILPYCGARVSVSERGRYKDSAMHNMACLLAGKRDIIWRSMQDLKDVLTSDFLYDLVAFEQTAKADNIREFEGVSFRPNEEQNALLLVKLNLLEEQGLLEYNDYTTGYLLGYADEDMAFYHQRWDFHKQVDELPFTYPEFSPELKRKFDTFVQQTWNKSQQQKFEQDKQEALAWIQKQKQYSIEELYKQIDELKKKETK